MNYLLKQSDVVLLQENVTICSESFLSYILAFKVAHCLPFVLIGEGVQKLGTYLSRVRSDLNSFGAALFHRGGLALLDKPHTAKDHDQGLDGKDDSERNKCANDTSNGLGDAISMSRRVRGAVGISVGGTASTFFARAAAHFAPLLRAGDGKLGHTRFEVTPGLVVLTKEGELLQVAGRRGAVAVEEPDLDVVAAGCGVRARSEYLKCHGRGVASDALEITGNILHLGEAKECHKGTVRAELDIELGAAGRAVYDGLQGVQDLAGKDGARNGSHRVASIVCQIPFESGSKTKASGERLFRQQVIRRNRRVVDSGNIDQVPDCRLLRSG